MLDNQGESLDIVMYMPESLLQHEYNCWFMHALFPGVLWRRACRSNCHSNRTRER
jgi:hypothetical protein